MKYYSKLLTTAFSVLTEQREPQTLVLLPVELETSQESTRKESGHFQFPAHLLPPNSDCRHFPADESFVVRVLEDIESTQSKCVFAFPPLVGDLRLSIEWRDRFGRLGVAEALANGLLGGVAPGNDLFATRPSPVQAFAMLVPRHFIGSMRSDAWRREFFPAHSAVIIEHEVVPQAIGLPIHSSFQFATVIFQRNPGPIRFFKVTTSAADEDAAKLANDLRRLLQQPAGKSKYGYVYQGAIKEGYPCSYDFHSEETEKLRAEIGELGDRVSLGSVADVLQGARPCHPERESGEGTTGFQFIAAHDITPDGRVVLSEVQTQTRPARLSHYLNDGDLCIRQIYRPDAGFIVGVYEGDGRLITFNQTVIVVRPHATLNPAQRQVLLSFLRSPLSHRLGNAKQLLSSLGEHLRVTPQVLRDFPVPIADEELVSSIQQLSEARQAFTRWIEQIDEESNAIVLESTASGSRRRILQAGQLARQRHRAGQQVEELDYRVRTQFPHPLAYIWRELQVAGTDRYQRLRAVTKAAEGNTCFVALIAILISQKLGQPISYVKEIAKRLSQWKSGTNFGDWIAIIQEINEGRAFSKAATKAPFAEVMQLCSSDSWKKAIQILKDLRDDDSHLRIAPASVSPKTLADAETALETVYRATEFLTDYQLMFVTETRFDSIRNLNRFHYRDLTGDNALAPLRQDESPRPDLEAGSVYLRDRQNQLHLFRPLLHYLECPECHLMSMFFLDTYDGSSGKNVVGLKSFERNSIRTEPIADDFRHIGLLT